MNFSTRIRRAPTLAQQVYESLRDSIIEGQLQPGERLVFEQLAPRFGVSQTPVREAVIHLVQDGLAAPGPDGKLYVISLTEEYVADIFLIRSVLEGLAAELAAHRLSDAEITALRVPLADGTRALAEGDGQRYGESITEFHQRIRDGAGSPTLSRELRSLSAHVDFIFTYARRQVGHHQERAQEEHWAIFEALSSRDGAAARALLEQHIRNAGERVVDIITAARE